MCCHYNAEPKSTLSKGQQSERVEVVTEFITGYARHGVWGVKELVVQGSDRYLLRFFQKLGACRT